MLIPETRWRACEEAVAAAAGPKRREGIAAGTRHHREKRRRLPSPERCWRTREEAVAATAGPKHPEGLGAGARHLLGSGSFIPETRWRACEEVQTKQSLVLHRLLREVNSMCRRRSRTEASRAA
ncbi:hypothetical protein H839_17258 [Parageobacillus genomosp. 1]|uniref:Uncharacterized protein n=1 Tax=Parageobacillus genomosp. 1 TaxID=1295642 RepID=A0ABC9VAV6_9BACL|nr:hypothetical protein H839_17258 [Parageobacillus genomosp. 1]